MKITKTIQMALLLGAIGLSSCSRVYTSRNYVKANDSAKATEKELERKQISVEEIAQKKPKSLELTALSTPSEELVQVPFTTPSRTEKMETKGISLPVEVLSTIPTDKLAEAPQVKEETSAVPAPKDKTGEKSQLVALLLCIFVGYLGIHRFYLGYTGIGVIQLLTLGGCGIWSLIDLIMIITGDLEPKNGPYDKTFDDM